MNHSEAETLLGAYALHSVTPLEAAEIEQHLAECPRCTAEVQSHLETAAMIGNLSAEAPEGLWEKIATIIREDVSAQNAEPPGIAVGTVVPLRPRKRAGRVVAAAVSLAAAAALVVFGVELSNLQGQVHDLKSALRRTGLSAAIASAEAAPHRTVTLSASGRSLATLVVNQSDEAYWISSELASLNPDRTYQLWGLSQGRVVSLGLVGSDPHSYSAFRIARPVTELMVTAEPAGGTPTPTGPILAKGSVPLE